MFVIYRLYRRRGLLKDAEHIVYDFNGDDAFMRANFDAARRTLPHWKSIWMVPNTVDPLED